MMKIQCAGRWNCTLMNCNGMNVDANTVKPMVRRSETRNERKNAQTHQTEIENQSKVDEEKKISYNEEHTTKIHNKHNGNVYNQKFNDKISGWIREWKEIGKENTNKWKNRIFASWAKWMSKRASEQMNEVEKKARIPNPKWVLLHYDGLTFSIGCIRNICINSKRLLKQNDSLAHSFIYSFIQFYRQPLYQTVRQTVLCATQTKRPHRMWRIIKRNRKWWS